jgi:hypothetical protein
MLWNFSSTFSPATSQILMNSKCIILSWTWWHKNTYNPSSLEAEAGGSQLQDQHGLQRETMSQKTNTHIYIYIYINLYIYMSLYILSPSSLTQTSIAKYNMWKKQNNSCCRSLYVWQRTMWTEDKIKVNDTMWCPRNLVVQACLCEVQCSSLASAIKCANACALCSVTSPSFLLNRKLLDKFSLK